MISFPGFSLAAIIAACRKAQISPFKIILSSYLNHFCRLRRHRFLLSTLAANEVCTKPVSCIHSFWGSVGALTKA